MDPLIKSQLLYQLSYAPIKAYAGLIGPRDEGVISKGPGGCPAGLCLFVMRRTQACNLPGRPA